MAVSVGRACELVDGARRIRTAFVKHPAAGPVRLTFDGLEGDEHVYRFHGGPDMALLVYSHDHYRYWQEVCHLDLPVASAWGENLTVEGLTESDVCIGDVFSAGDCVIQVTQPRAPCYKLAARYGVKEMAAMVQETGFTGYLARVLRTGTLFPGQILSLVTREGHGVRVAEAGRVLNVDTADLDAARRILELESLGSVARRTLQSRLRKPPAPGPDVERLYGA